MLATAQNRRLPPHGLLASAINYLSRAVARPSDSEDEVLRKAVLAFMVEMGIVVAIVWASAYLLMGFPIAAAIPTTIGVVSLLGLVYLFWTKDYHPVLEANIILVLSLSFLLQWILGGFNASGGVMLWAIMAPLASLLFQGGRRALFWFLVYIALTIVSGVIDGRVAQHAVHLPEPILVASFVMNFLGVSVVFYLVIRYFLSQLQTAKAESERLLLNILPAAVAQRLKEGETLIADQLDDVTVVLADIAGFTPLSAQLPPGDVVAMLNDLFSAFDELANRHGLEKIRTMGDSYMAVAGAPSWRPDHAQIAADMALDMLAIVDSYTAGPLSRIQIRIGMNTGPVTAGVIGKQKFVYDVYGDTVNTASRMESQGVPGWIQVTEATYRRLQWDYCLEPRGHIEVKGKGDMMTYWLRRRRDEQRTA